jgi:hypothetical protein
VVSIQVLDQTDDVQAESQDDRADLTGLPRVGQEVDHFLDSSSTVHVERDGNKVIGDRLADDAALFFGRVFQQLLAEVVAEWVCDRERKSARVPSPKKKKNTHPSSTLGSARKSP